MKDGEILTTGTESNESGLFQYDLSRAVEGGDFGAFGTEYPVPGDASKILNYGKAIGPDWLTLTKTEWDYILSHHASVWCTVKGIYGCAFAPDDYDITTLPWATTGNELNNWEEAEAYGVVFIPAAGFMQGDGLNFGELYIDGQIMNNVEPMNRHIAMVFQNYALYPHMTVYQNMAFALKLRKRNMPIYQPNEKADAIKSEINKVYRKIRRVDRKYKKDQNSKELLQRHIDLYNQVFKLNDKMQGMLKPVLGINLVRIDELNEKIKKFEKEKESINNLIDKNKKLSEDELKVLKNGLAQRDEQLKAIKKEIRYLQTNNTELVKNRHLTKREIDIEVNKTALSIDLTRYLFRKPSALSGGQRQRVALGRAIVRKPKVFLMDEPLSNLDAKLRVQTRSEISKLHKRVGATTIYVTHDQTEAMTMADRIVIMKDGYIQQVGTPDEVYNDPANKFVGGFIGSPSMNFLNGTYSRKAFVFNKSKVSVALDSKTAKVVKSKDIILGIRPEDIYLQGNKNNANPSKALNAVVTFSELLGSSLIVYATVEGQNILFETKANEKVKIGQKLKVCFDLNKLYLFDKETEKRIK